MVPTATPASAAPTLPAAVGAHARDLDEAALAVHDQRAVVDRHDLAELLALHLGEGAGDALRRVEHEQLLAIERGPGAGCGIAAADQVVDDVDVVRPVDARFRIADDALVAGVRLVLRERRAPCRPPPARPPRPVPRRPSGRSCRSTASPACPPARSAPSASGSPGLRPARRSGGRCEKPVSVRPQMIAQLIDEAPRCSGSRLGWNWIVPNFGMLQKSCGTNWVT